MHAGGPCHHVRLGLPRVVADRESFGGVTAFETIAADEEGPTRAVLGFSIRVVRIDDLPLSIVQAALQTTHDLSESGDDFLRTYQISEAGCINSCD